MTNLSDSELYELIVETSYEGIWVIDKDNRTAFVNKRMAEIIGYETHEMLGKELFDFMDTEGIAITNRNLERRKNGIAELHEFKLISKSGRAVWTYMNTSPVVRGNEYIGALAMVCDITEIKQNERNQLENYRNYISLFEDSPVPIWDEDFSQIKRYIDELKEKGIKDFHSYFTQHNDELIKCAEMLVVNKINQAVVDLNEGESKEHVLKNFRKLVNKKSPEYALIQLMAIANNETFCQFDAELKTFKGNRRFVHFQWSVVKGYEDTYQRVYLTTTDVTERIKEENLLLQNSNREKAVLLKEVHHRVKNNLQIITSLLNLQSRAIEDKAIKAIFDVSLSRINSMATVHELLYKSNDFSRIDYREYLNSLVFPLLRTMCGDEQEVAIELDVENCFININTAIPLGLLINEILTNSLKHGIREGEKGHIYIRIHKTDSDIFELRIGDNGKGFNPDKESNNGDKLGMQLIDSLVEQLSGSLERDYSMRGTHYRISFRELLQSAE